MSRVRVRDRRLGLGGSDVAGALGLPAFATPVHVFLEKTDGWQSQMTEQMQLGQAIEGALVAEGARHLDRKVRRNRTTWSHPDWPAVPIFATPDGIAAGGDVLVEVKNVAAHYDEWKDGEPAPRVRAQNLVQLACFPRAAMVLDVVLLGGRLEFYEVQRDEAAQAELVELATGWWNDYVVPGIVPPPATDDDRWMLARRALRLDERTVREATDDETAAATDLIALRSRIRELEAEAEATRLRLAEQAVDIDLAGPGFRATWSTRVVNDYAGAWRELAGDGTELPAAFRRETSTFTVRSARGGTP